MKKTNKKLAMTIPQSIIGAATYIVAAVLLSSGCVVQGARTLDEESLLQGTGSAPVPENMLAHLDEDFSKEYGVKDVFALQKSMLMDPAIEKPISLDRFLEEMKKDPRAKDIFKFWTAAYHSGSRQEGTEKSPRAILVSESGAFTMTFTAATEQRINQKTGEEYSYTLDNGDQIEMVQVNPQSFRKDFYQMYFPIDFSMNSKAPKANPGLCAGCHSHTKAKTAVHIWGRYPLWPGILGSGEDFMFNKKGEYSRQYDCPDNPQVFTATDETLKEYEILQNLHAMIRGDVPRYRHLYLPEDAAPEYPFSNVPRGYFKYRPNFRMGGLWHRLHIKNVVWEAKQKDYQKMKNLFLYGFFSCDEIVPEEDSLAMMKRYEKIYNANTKHSDKAKQKIKGFKESSYKNITWMNSSLSIVGMNLHGLTINDTKVSKFAYKSGYFPGGDKSDRLLARLLVEDDSRSTQPSLDHQAYFMAKTPICNEKMGLDDYRFLRKFGYRPELKEGAEGQGMCQQILRNLGVKK